MTTGRAVRLVVIACGNESRGDDGLGPAFLAAAQAVADPPGVETTFVGDFQLQPEHAVDLAGQDLALFVDAARDAGAPYALRAAVPARSATFTTHGMTPAVVLDAYARTYGRAPPPAFTLAIRAACFDLGTPLSPRARRDLAAALDLFARLRRGPSVEAWRNLASQARKEDPCASQLS